MARALRRPLLLMLHGTSLTAGRLATPPDAWTLRLEREMRGHPNCKGELVIVNIGRGSQTSDFGRTQAELWAPLRPDVVLMEDFGINDCAIGPVTLPQAAANFDAMVAAFRGANPDVVITHQTMSPASAADANRVELPLYYAQGTAKAAEHGLETLDNYADWPKPLDPALTVSADGLHPLWDDAFELYSYPNILAWAVAAMAAHWPDPPAPAEEEPPPQGAPEEEAAIFVTDSDGALLVDGDGAFIITES